jgi:glucose/arabinose dehydrogenase/PKD repeat protein
MRNRLLFGVALSLAAAALIPIAPAEGAGSLPLGFTDQFLFRVEQPTAIAFTPDNRMLVTSRPGRLFVATGGVVRATASLDLRSKICFNSERGLLGVAVDPAFTTNHFIYLFYTFKKFTGCPTKNASQPVHRVSRFVLPDSNVIAPSSEVVLIDNVPSPNGYHNAGDLNFGSDGMLYVSVGDGGCGKGSGFQCTKPGALNGLLGKILRITRNGGIPADNPYQGAGTLACADSGSATLGTTCREIYARGLRNPFRFAMDPNTAGRFYINDVGNHWYEEIDLGQAGADYGWETREGHCKTDAPTNCGPAPQGMTNPIFDYSHTSGCTSIVGGAFVPNDAGWPASYLGKYMFADYVCGRIFRLDQEGSGYVMTPIVTGLGTGTIVHIEFGPREPRRALYYTTFANGGEIRRVAFTSDGKPIAEMTASPLTGPAPLTVDFDASASADPEEEALTYLWNFGDGETDTTTTPLVSHTYDAEGTFSASLVVRDPGGLESSPFALTIVSGNTAPVPVITSPAEGATFAVGQTLTLNGTASDAEDGQFPASALSWRVWLFHRDHRHPYVGPVSGNGITFTGPPPEDLQAATNSYLIVELTVTDSDGMSTMVSRTIQPRSVALTFKTKPAGLRLVVAGTNVFGPTTVLSWAKWEITIRAPSPQGQYRFLSWSDNGLAEHQITTPGTPTTYTATFVKAGL